MQKIYWTISEVANMLNTTQTHVRWIEKTHCLKIQRRKNKRRYKESDIYKIYDLYRLHEHNKKELVELLIKQMEK